MSAPVRVGACAMPAKIVVVGITCHISIRYAVAIAPAVRRAGSDIFSKMSGCV